MVPLKVSVIVLINITKVNPVDLIILGVLIFFCLEALGRPLILELLDLVSFLLAFFISFRYYNLPAGFFVSQFHIPHGLSLVLGFMSAWFLSEIIVYFLIKLIIPKIHKIRLHGLDNLSIIPSLARGLIFIALTLVLLATFPIQPSIKKAVLDSKIGSQILKNAYSLEGPVKEVFGGVSNDSLTFLTIKPKTDERVDLGFKITDFKVDESSEKIMFDLVNKERLSQGVKALEFDNSLRDVGRKHSADMLTRGYFSHYSPENKTVADRVTEAGIDFLVIGENLAYAPSVELAHKGLMNSEGHRANILSTDYNKVGIGIMDGGVYGEMFTQVFSN